VPPDVHYPDLTPPTGWDSALQGLQVRIVPPGETLAEADVSIIVSPLVPRQPLLPPPADLIAEALFTESRQRLDIVSQKGPTPDKTLGGLLGVSFEVECYVRPFSPREKRVYVMYSDAICCYAVSYLARAPSFAKHLPAFWAAARSIRPFRGKLLHPSGPSPTATLYSD
jgi:hypothetical protein